MGKFFKGNYILKAIELEKEITYRSVGRYLMEENREKLYNEANQNLKGGKVKWN